MSYDEMELDRLGDKRTAAFFIISDTDTTYNFIVALAFSQMLHEEMEVIFREES